MQHSALFEQHFKRNEVFLESNSSLLHGNKDQTLYLFNVMGEQHENCYVPGIFECPAILNDQRIMVTLVMESDSHQTLLTCRREGSGSSNNGKNVVHSALG